MRAPTAASEDRLAEQAYQAMASVYDEFTAHHEYRQWLEDLLLQLRELGLEGQRLLDVGCGTGKSFLPMLDWEWQVTACDISSSMVDLARQKAGRRAELAVADMRQLPAFGEYDLVWALGEAVNYMLSPAELEQALHGMRDNLAPRGLLAFDALTLLSYRTFFAQTVRVERPDGALVWRGQASAEAEPGSINEAYLEIEGQRSKDAGSEAILHRHRHFTERELRAIIDSCDLQCVAVFGSTEETGLSQPLDELSHPKGVYVCQLA